MPVEGVMTDEVADAVAVATFEVVAAEWVEATEALDTAAEVEQQQQLLPPQWWEATAAEVAEAALVTPGTTIVPVAVGVPVVYTKMGESRAGVESAVNMTACLPSGCTGLFPGSFKRVPVAFGQRDILNSHMKDMDDF